MSTPKDVLTEVKSVLTADATLAGYVKRVVLGLREAVPDTDYPIIMIEPAQLGEEELMSDFADGLLRVTIVAYTKNWDIEGQLTGDANYKGVLDIENDIKKALAAVWPSLNGKAATFDFTQSEFAISDASSAFPLRGVFMDLDVRFRTSFSART